MSVRVYKGEKLLAYRSSEWHNTVVLAVEGACSSWMLRECGIMMDGWTIEQPDRDGLSLFEGEFVTSGEENISAHGLWRPALMGDVLAFKLVAGPRTERGFCCELRRKFQIGIVHEDTSVQMPIEAVDLVQNWGMPIVLTMKYCPFCGQMNDGRQVVRNQDRKQ